MKKYVALALSAACSFAAAQTNVSVYGVVDAGIVYSKGGPAGSATKIDSGLSGGSRLGFRGSEDLGGGLSAIFTVENGFLSDTGGVDQGGLLFGRQAFVGLKGNSGTLTLGRQYTPSYRVLTTIDPFENNFGGASGQLMAGERAGVRMNNAAIYATPTFGGFDGQFGYGFGEVAGDSSRSRQLSANIGYGGGPLVVRAGFNRTNNATATDAARSALLIGKYNFGVATAGLGYGSVKGTGSTNYRDYIAALTVPLGRHTVMATYIHKDDKSSAGASANQAAMAYTYALSKRTQFYTAYSKLSNTRFATTKFGPGDAELDIGVRHSF